MKVALKDTYLVDLMVETSVVLMVVDLVGSRAALTDVRMVAQ